MHLNLFSKGSAASTQVALTMIQICAEVSNVAIQEPSTKEKTLSALVVFNSCTMRRATSGNNTVLQKVWALHNQYQSFITDQYGNK